MTSFELKVGDTFHFPLGKMTQVVSGVKQPVDLTGMVFLSQVRDLHSVKIADCTINITNALQGEIEMLPVATGAWPLKELFWDIQTSRGGIVVSSKTVSLKMVKDVTQ